MDSTVVNPFQVAGSENGTTPWAKLLLYTPHHWDTQVLRPFIYGFEESTVNKLLGAGDTLSDAFKRQDIASSQEVAKSIVPDTVGSQVGMETYSELWTFVLILHQPNNYAGVAMSASGSRTIVLSGHCIGEPVNPMTLYMTTPTVNPACQLVVQSRQVLNEGNAIASAVGMRRPVTVTCSDDIIDPSLNQAAKNTDLYVLTPYNVLTNFDYNGTTGSAIATSGLCMVGNQNREPVQAALKTAGVHMSMLLQGLDAQNREAQSARDAPSSIGSFGVLSDCEDIDAYKNGVANKYTQMNSPNIIQTGGLDVMSIFTINDVQLAYPNLIVQPQRIAAGATMDLLPQTNASPKIAYSSFISSAVSSIAVDCGLSSISFMFTSFDPMKKNELDHTTFQVVPDSVGLVVPPADPSMYSFTLRASVEMFRAMFQKNVAPFVTGVVGNFEVRAMYSNTGDTHVDLQLLDWGSNTNLGTLWFETPNRLGCLSSTSLGNEAAFNTNAQSINALVMLTEGKTQMNAMGIPAFRDPTITSDQAPLFMPNLAGIGSF